MVRRYAPGLDSAQRRGSLRRRTLALLAGLSLTLIAIDLVLMLEFAPWKAFQHKTSLDHARAGPSAVWPSIESSGPLLRRRLAAADTMLAAGNFRGAQHEYLMILLSVAPDSAQAWRGLVTLHRRWAAEKPAELGRQVKAYRLAIRNGTEMDERYSPQALAVLAKATMLAANEIEGTRRRLASVRTRWRPIAGYVISVGEFANPTMADRMMHLIRSKGYIVDVARRGRVSQVVTRPYRTRQQAEYVVHGLEGLGMPANLMARQLPSQSVP
jgi:hypothetical protein